MGAGQSASVALTLVPALHSSPELVFKEERERHMLMRGIFFFFPSVLEQMANMVPSALFWPKVEVSYDVSSP